MRRHFRHHISTCRTANAEPSLPGPTKPRTESCKRRRESLPSTSTRNKRQKVKAESVSTAPTWIRHFLVYSSDAFASLEGPARSKKLRNQSLSPERQWQVLQYKAYTNIAKYISKKVNRLGNASQCRVKSTSFRILTQTCRVLLWSYADYAGQRSNFPAKAPTGPIIGIGISNTAKRR